MFGFKKKTPVADDGSENTQEKTGLFARLKAGLSKTGSDLTAGMGDLLLGEKIIDDKLLEDLETRLLTADVGVEATTRIIDDLTQQSKRNELQDATALKASLANSMQQTLAP
ncbi:MAG: signal recognition particle-docking protein FtsY, partial [Thiothrix sp.]